MSKSLSSSAYAAIEDSQRLPLPGAEASAANPHQIIDVMTSGEPQGVAN
jgi:hypothetical protein